MRKRLILRIQNATFMKVVLLHGFGETAGIWEDFIPLLPDKFQYITLDYSKITFCQSIEEYADWVHFEMDKKHITRFVLIGHSMGGYISLAYARKYADYLAGLGLFHSTAYADSDEKKVSRDNTIRFIEKHGAVEFIEDFLPNMYNDAYKKENKIMIQQQLKDNQEIPAKALIAATKAMRERPDTSEVLKKLEIPVLLIAGKQDKFIPFAASLEQVAMCKHPYALMLNHIAHAGMHEAPSLCAELVSEFLRSI